MSFGGFPFALRFIDRMGVCACVCVCMCACVDFLDATRMKETTKKGLIINWLVAEKGDTKGGEQQLQLHMRYIHTYIHT